MKALLVLIILLTYSTAEAQFASPSTVKVNAFNQNNVTPHRFPMFMLGNRIKGDVTITPTYNIHVDNRRWSRRFRFLSFGS